MNDPQVVNDDNVSDRMRFFLKSDQRPAVGKRVEEIKRHGRESRGNRVDGVQAISRLRTPRRRPQNRYTNNAVKLFFPFPRIKSSFILTQHLAVNKNYAIPAISCHQRVSMFSLLSDLVKAHSELLALTTKYESACRTK